MLHTAQLHGACCQHKTNIMASMFFCIRMWNGTKVKNQVILTVGQILHYKLQKLHLFGVTFS